MKDNIVLHIGGKEMTFSEKELAMAVEYYFAKEFGTSPESDIHGYRKPMLIPASPIEGKWFRVNPMCIDRKLFAEKRQDSSQETVRRAILTAFDEVDKNRYYSKPFETLIPLRSQLQSIFWAEAEKTTIRYFEGLIKTYNSSYAWANRIEQYLEWAQRIQNGDTWEALCNEEDHITRHRLVVGTDKNSIYTVGGSYMGDKSNVPTYITKSLCIPGFEICGAVPLIVRRQ